jgi:hypothetical protein
LDCTTVAEEVLVRLGKTPPPTSAFRFAQSHSREVTDYFDAMTLAYDKLGEDARDATREGDIVVCLDDGGLPRALFVMVDAKMGTFLTSTHNHGVRALRRSNLKNVASVHRLKEDPE